MASRSDMMRAVGAASLVFGPPCWAGEPRSRDEGYEVQKSDAEWRNELSRSAYFVLRRGGTERPNSSPLAREKRKGDFVCAGCGTPLFRSDDKFESGTGWPSFADATENVEVERVALEMVTGAELRCKRCGGHLGDRFLDGKLFPGTAAAKTGMRYCIDGAALVFLPADGSPPRRGDVDPSQQLKTPQQTLPKWLQPPPVNERGASSA